MVIVLWFFRSSFDGSSRQIHLVSLPHPHYELEEKEEEEEWRARREVLMRLKPGTAVQDETRRASKDPPPKPRRGERSCG